MSIEDGSELPGCIVVGGAAINQRNEKWYIQSRFLSYLKELEILVGQIHFFASWYMEENSVLFPEEVPSTIEIHPLKIAPSLLGKLTSASSHLLEYNRALKNADFVIHFFPAALNPVNQLLLRKQSKSYLSYFKSDWIMWTQSQGRTRQKVAYWKALERRECKLCDVAVFRSQIHHQRLKHLCRESTISQPILSISKPSPHVTHKKDENSISLLFVGMIAPEKGLRELIAALGTILKKETSEFKLHLVGAPHKNTRSVDGHYQLPQWLQSDLENNQLEGHVISHGFVDNPETLGTIFASADIFVLPSWSEGFPRVLDEAMSHSLPILSTTVGGIGEILTTESDSILIPPKDVDALFHSIKRLISDEALRSSLGRAGHKNYLSRVTQSAASQHAELLYLSSRKPL